MLRTKILSIFDKALSTGHVVWRDSTAHFVFAASVRYQFRLATALAQKPAGHETKPATTQKDFNPFLPYDEALFVESFDNYNLLLNKFSIVRGHVLLTTKDFQRQVEPLNASDFAAAWRTLHAPGMSQYMCFYNSGKNAGASQHHKHLQLIPEADEDAGQPFPPIRAILSAETESVARPGTPFKHEALPFAHCLVLLPSTLSSEEPIAAGKQLEALYQQSLKKAFGDAGHDMGTCLDPDTQDRSAQPSYNVVLTSEFLMVVPRRAERADGISLNAVAFAGMMLVKSQEELDLAIEKGPIELLTQVTYPVSVKKISDPAAVDAQIAQIQKKISIEQTLHDGANKMLRNLTDKSAREQCEMNALEAKRRMSFLEGELRKLHIRKSSVSAPQQGPPFGGVAAGSGPTFGSRHSSLEDVMDHRGSGRGGTPAGSGTTTPSRGAASVASSSAHSLEHTNSGPTGITNFDNMKYGTALTAEKVKYRLKEVRHKLAVEQKVKAGTENMVKALSIGPSASQDPTVMGELMDKIAEANAKTAFLQKAEHKYSGLTVVEEEEEEGYLADVRMKKTGRLRAKIIGATNLPGRRSAKDEIMAIVRVDGVIKHETKPTRNQWQETIDIQVDKAQEVEIAVYDRSWTLLGLVWFRLWELEEDIKVKHGGANDDVDETWLDLEPAGQILAKLNFVAMGRAKTARDQVFRRNPVQKVFPKNGHRFLPQSFYHVMQCALCNEFLGRQGYQCQSCSYTVHAKCYNRVITKCLTKEDVRIQKDANTGQLLKYTIPHRWESTTNLGAAWCTHCGYMLPPGRKMHKCTECSKTSHKECSPLVPHFCGLAPEMADTLVAAFEEHERKLHQKEMEDAEKARRESRRASVGTDLSADSAATVASIVDDYVEPRPPPRDHSIHSPSAFPPPKPLPQVPEPGQQQSPVPALPSTRVEVRPHQKPYPGTQQEQQTPPPVPYRGGVPLPIPPRPADVLPPQHHPQYQQQQQQHYPPQTQPPPQHLQQQPPRPLRLPPTEVTLNDFNFLAVLGRGAFGKVMLASEKATQSLYAIKALKKEFIIQNDDVKSTKLEKRIFQAASAAHHPFLVNLHSCFQTDTRVYFVMEYVSGGDLMAHIQEKKRFSQARAKFYACEVLLALEYFHANNIIYRDLKLDNILMAPDGHIKVADYGICKENMPYGQTTRTFCGTPDYMAPEVLSSNRYGRSVDWWSFGVLIYVMLVGRYPFHGEDEQDVLDAILNDAVEYPSNIPKDTLSLLQGLMNKNPARRLGGGRLGAEEIKRHPYFIGVDWKAFMDKRIPPPWVPTIKHATDVSNFDPEFTREKAVLTPINSVLSTADQNEFRDFTYVSEWANAARAGVAVH
ncbi:Serine/threonine kinase [Geranomyces variabilis]|nr:Serine/threonine kinase [Geranomyces variabilis]